MVGVVVVVGAGVVVCGGSCRWRVVGDIGAVCAVGAIGVVGVVRVFGVARVVVSLVWLLLFSSKFAVVA